MKPAVFLSAAFSPGRVLTGPRARLGAPIHMGCRGALRPPYYPGNADA